MAALLMWPFSRTKALPFTIDNLLDVRLGDGSRLFAELWQTEEIEKGACVHLDLIHSSDPPSIRFAYKGFLFSATSSQGECFFAVDDPTCDDATLMKVALHFNRRLRRVTVGCGFVSRSGAWVRFHGF